jgi:hypothetical protein
MDKEDLAVAVFTDGNSNIANNDPPEDLHGY